MKRYLALILTIIVISATLSSYTSALEIRTDTISLDGIDRVPGEIILVFKEDTPREDRTRTMLDLCSKAHGTNDLQTLNSYIDHDDSRFQVIRVPDEKVLKTIVSATRNSSILFAEPNRIFFPAYDDMSEPFDIDFPQYSYDPAAGLSNLGQWHLDRIQAKETWDSGFYGSENTIVAVLDTGYNYHPDLDANIDHSLAYNAVDQTHSNYNDSHHNGHGTFVAGVIGARLNNVGTNGICPNVKIVPVKVSNRSDGAASESVIIKRGIEYAKTIGADVINISYAHCTVAGVGEAVRSFGELVVMSAGNNNVEITPYSPSASGLANWEPNWVIVGASTYDNDKWEYSNYSSNYVDIIAPGKDILSTSHTGEYRTGSGTSFSAPIVTASIALIKSRATHLTPIQIKSHMMRKVTQAEGFERYCVSQGIFNLYKSIIEIYNENRGAYSRGDANGNGTIDSTDCLVAKRIALDTYTPTAEEIDILDIDRDGSVTSIDYMLIKRYYEQTYYFPPR